MTWLQLVALGVTAFVATNLDDILLLVLFFSNSRYRARDVFIGQATGIGFLVIISLFLSLVVSTILRPWVGILGLLPVLIGAREMILRRHNADDGDDAPRPSNKVLQLAPGRDRALAVAGVTVANGGDNLAVYTALFSTHSSSETIVLLQTFVILLLIWLYGVYYLVRRSAVADKIQRVGHAIFPYALIALGIFIMIEGFRS